jgi:predicted acyltransferase
MRGSILDKFILGDSHLYHGEGIAFDPEGILSTLPAIVNVVVGYYAGKYIQDKGKGYETVSKAPADGRTVHFFSCCAGIWFSLSIKNYGRVRSFWLPQG